MSETKQCPQCKAEASIKHHFCLQCGFMFASVEASAPVDNLTPAQPLANSGKPDVSPNQNGVHPSPQSPSPQSPSPQSPSPQSQSSRPQLAAPSAPSPLERRASVSPLVDLLLIRSPDLPTVRFAVHDQSQIGRLQGQMIFKEDPYISPHHATFYYKDQQLMVRDEMSLNGIFIRLNRSIEVEMNEVFVAGEQMFMVEMDLNPIPTLTNVEKDTRFFANSQNNNPNAIKRLTHLLEGGQRGICVPFIESSLSVGRQGCDLNFPQDRFMSSRHCHVSLENERVVLTDMGSRNGTFVQIKGETSVAIGDFLLIGKQLLQVQPHQSEAQAHISI